MVYICVGYEDMAPRHSAIGSRRFERSFQSSEKNIEDLELLICVKFEIADGIGYEEPVPLAAMSNA